MPSMRLLAVSGGDRDDGAMQGRIIPSWLRWVQSRRELLQRLGWYSWPVLLLTYTCTSQVVDLISGRRCRAMSGDVDRLGKHGDIDMCSPAQLLIHVAIGEAIPWALVGAADGLGRDALQLRDGRDAAVLCLLVGADREVSL